MNTWLAETWFTGFGGGDAVFVMIRLALGAFFVFSGYHKLFNKQRHATLVKTLEDSHIPYIKYMQWIVPSIEFFGGLGIVFGFMTVLAGVGLLCLLIVATCTDGLKRIPAEHPLDWADWADCLIYLPEVLLIFLLMVVLANGPGIISVDRLIYQYL